MANKIEKGNYVQEKLMDAFINEVTQICKSNNIEISNWTLLESKYLKQQNSYRIKVCFYTVNDISSIAIFETLKRYHNLSCPKLKNVNRFTITIDKKGGKMFIHLISTEDIPVALLDEFEGTIDHSKVSVCRLGTVLVLLANEDKSIYIQEALRANSTVIEADCFNNPVEVERYYFRYVGRKPDESSKG